MKLLTKTSFFYVISFSIILLLGGIIFYRGLVIIFYKQIDEGLIAEKSIIEEEISHNDSIPDFSTRFGHEIKVILYGNEVKPYNSIKNTTVEGQASSSELEFRHLNVKGNISGKGFSISILHPLTETHLFINNIIKTMLIMLLFVFVSLVIFNLLISKKIWKPFYHTIFQLRQYDIKSRQKLSLRPTNINEFDILNTVITDMSDKIQADYINLKEFTEDASHEIQTPLAIINSKIEMLIQSPNLTNEQAESINIINHAIARLSKLNSGLLLISRIENNQFNETEKISINDLIENTLKSYNDFIRHKKLNVHISFEVTLHIYMNPTLADILINNLINNSIKHNINEGFITIVIQEECIMIENSGEKFEPNVNPSELFNRFKKGSNSNNSVGLGLAIIKKICDANRFSISYEQVENKHKIEIFLC